MPNYTPLRYPGGKARLKPYIEALIDQNGLQDAHYVEPYCGGAGLALDLLQSYVVDTIHINDLDRAIYSFWFAAVHETDALCAKIDSTPCNMDTWHEQHAIWKSRDTADPQELAFATFFSIALIDLASSLQAPSEAKNRPVNGKLTRAISVRTWSSGWKPLDGFARG